MCEYEAGEKPTLKKHKESVHDGIKSATCVNMKLQQIKI
jgi:hypothetical protein